MIKVSRAQVYLKVGLSLDQWADAIIDGSRNDKVLAVDCSQGVNALEKPTGKVDASMGDVHPNGNPHYWLDPRNGAIVARNIAEGFARADARARGRLPRARRGVREGVRRRVRARQGHGGAPAVAGPSSPTTARGRTSPTRSGSRWSSTVEPVPGIPPTARHLQELVDTAKSRHVALLIQEPYFAADAGKFLTRSAGVRVVTASSSCDDEKAGSYLAHVLGVLAECAGGTAK